MSESVTTVDINTAALEKKIESISNAAEKINKEVREARTDINKAIEELNLLKYSFEKFIEENKKSENLQKAATELVRVRQEIEQNYGKYKIVRETMLGVLQATDVALVKKNTISQVTEELMLSTPDYWLAPCLVAVSAWIGNDRALAERAIKEAMNRDEEKTALTMALICRRNNRTETCYEWLSIYFAKQNAKNFTESNFTYLNAYLNGVFGPDTKHMCDDYVANWMSEIQENSMDFENEQEKIWSRYCENFTVDLEGQFPWLKNCVHEYGDIEAYVGRINAEEKIAVNFSRMKNIDVDQQKLKKDIDHTLVTLVSRYDDKEEPLRNEERYLLAVRNFNGDTNAARLAIIEAERKRTETAINLVGQMTNVINKAGANPSEKKTAVLFLSTYIRNGYKRYITEKKPSFPKSITLKVEDWKAVTTDGSNISEMEDDFEKFMENKCKNEIAAKTTDTPRMLRLASAIFAFIGIFSMFSSYIIGLFMFSLAGMCLYKFVKVNKDIVQNIDIINYDYKLRIENGKAKIEGTIEEWNRAKEIVDGFENRKMRDIVA